MNHDFNRLEQLELNQNSSKQIKAFKQVGKLNKPILREKFKILFTF